MNSEIIELQDIILKLYKAGIDVDVEIVNQITNGNIDKVESGDMPLFTYTDYIRLNGVYSNDWRSGESFNTLEEALKNGIKRSKNKFKCFPSDISTEIFTKRKELDVQSD